MVPKLPEPMESAEPSPIDSFERALGLVLGRCPHWNQVSATPQNKSQNKSHGSLKRMYCAGCCRLRWLGPLLWPCSVTLGFVEFDLVFPLSAQFCFGRWKLDRGGRTPKLKSMKSSVKPPWSPCMSNEEQSTIEQVSCTWQFSQCYCQICGWRSGWNPPEESWVPFGVSQQSILPWWSCTS